MPTQAQIQLANGVPAGTYDITVTDSDGLFISLTPVVGPAPNLAPTNITLSSSDVLEERGAGEVVGTISTTDPDGGDTHTYTLSGANASKFAIQGNQLVTSEQFDYETATSYTINIIATDQDGASFTKAFTINIVDVNESYTPPTAMTYTERNIDDAGVTRYYGEYVPDNVSNTDTLIVSCHGLGWQSNSANANSAQSGATMGKYLEETTYKSIHTGKHVIDAAAVLIPQQKSSASESSAADKTYLMIQDWATRNSKTLSNVKLIIDGMSYGGGTAYQFVDKYGTNFSGLVMITMAGTKGGITEPSVADWPTTAYYHVFGTDGDTTVVPSNQKDVAQWLQSAGLDAKYYMLKLGNHSGFNDRVYLTSGEPESAATGNYGTTSNAALINPPTPTVYAPDTEHILETAYAQLGLAETGIRVIRPNAAPTISINPAAQIITEGDSYTAPTVTANDDEDGDLTTSIVYTDPDGVFDGTLDTSSAGSFTGTVSVTDSQGQTTTATHTVTIQAPSSGNFTLLSNINLGNADVIAGYNSFNQEPFDTAPAYDFPLLDPNGAATNLVLRKPAGKVANETNNTFGVNAAGTETPAAANKSFWRWSGPNSGPLEVHLVSAAQTGVYLKPNTNYKVQVVQCRHAGAGLHGIGRHKWSTSSRAS